MLDGLAGASGMSCPRESGGAEVKDVRDEVETVASGSTDRADTTGCSAPAILGVVIWRGPSGLAARTSTLVLLFNCSGLDGTTASTEALSRRTKGLWRSVVSCEDGVADVRSSERALRVEGGAFGSEARCRWV